MLKVLGLFPVLLVLFSLTGYAGWGELEITVENQSKRYISPSRRVVGEILPSELLPEGSSFNFALLSGSKTSSHTMRYPLWNGGQETQAIIKFYIRDGTDILEPRHFPGLTFECTFREINGWSNTLTLSLERDWSLIFVKGTCLLFSVEEAASSSSETTQTDL